jgi:hypothetical protein
MMKRRWDAEALLAAKASMLLQVLRWPEAMDPNEILRQGLEVVKHAPELATGAAAVIGAFKFTEITRAMLGPAAGEVADRIHDEVRLYRFGRQLELLKKAEKMAKDAGFTPKAVPIKLLFPLLEGASLEEDEDLHTMWAALLANASDERSSSIVVHPSFPSTLRALSPTEAKFLDGVYALYVQRTRQIASEDQRYKEFWIRDIDECDLAVKIGLANYDHGLHESRAAVAMCIEVLQGERLLERTDQSNPLQFTKKGVKFIRSCRPPKTTQ